MFPFSDDLILNSYRATRREAGDLERLVEALQHSETHVKNTALNKLQVIGEQIKFLQKQAKEILESASTNTDLHKVPCNFVKVPGTIYHLYQRPSGEKLWSMISPQEFGANNKNEYLGSFRMEVDRSWTPVDKLQEYSESRAFAEMLMKQSQSLPAVKLIAEADEIEK